MPLPHPFRKSSPPIPDTIKPKSHFWGVVRAFVPLLIIAMGVFVFYNFPALKDRVTYTVHKPKLGNTGLLPASTRAKSAIPGSIPVGSSSDCGKPIPYDANGNPKQICDGYVYIPKIHVAAPIVFPSSPSEAVINDALLKGVLHYPGTAEPGQKGNVFLTGHSSYYWWVNSDYKFVFTLVPQLTYGDEIIIYNKGIRYTYKVSERREVGPEATDVLRPTSDPVVTLSTCVPLGTAYRRMIIRAKQTSPEPSSARPSSGDEVTTGRLPGVR